MRSASASLRDKLPFESTTFAVGLADGERSFLAPANPEAVLNAITDDQFDRDEQLPYWAEHWPSADGMLRFLADNPVNGPQSVCELGCGLGILSTALAVAGNTVVSVDISPVACQFARANLARNGAPAQVVCADWRAIPLQRSFDVVVAADVLYEERWIDPVIECITAIMAPAGKVIVADPCRRHWGAFKKRARDVGLVTDTTHRYRVNEGRTTIEVVVLSQQLPAESGQ
jgi:predicted nicotinamide N-methyase